MKAIQSIQISRGYPFSNYRKGTVLVNGFVMAYNRACPQHREPGQEGCPMCRAIREARERFEREEANTGTVCATNAGDERRMMVKLTLRECKTAVIGLHRGMEYLESLIEAHTIDGKSIDQRFTDGVEEDVKRIGALRKKIFAWMKKDRG